MKYIFNIAQIFVHEVGTILRDKGILIFILFVPIVYPLLYSSVYTNEVVRDVPVAVVDECNSTMTREMLRRMDATSGLKIEERCTTMEQAQKALSEQRVYGIIHIPADLERDIYLGRQTNIGLYCDLASMLYYKSLVVAVTDVTLETNKEIKVRRYIPGASPRGDEISAMPIEYDYVSLYNPQSGFAAFLIPPVLMLIIQQTLLLGMGMSIGNVREQYKGSIIPRLSYYRNAPCIVLGRALPYLSLYIVLAIYMFTIVSNMFNLPHLGHYSTFIAFIIPYILACICLAMVLSIFIYRREDCILLFVFLSVPMLFLSGLSWPSSAMPW
ncbi:MAG: ABC transporter permease, partial [Muribaculaceae bacterium]